MATWFIRVGHNPELAEKYSVIMIGYGIKEDITHLNDFKAIKNALNSNGRVAGLVNQFVNEINIGDTIICPFNKNKELYKVGTVKKSKCTVESFYDKKDGLKEFMNKYTVNEENLEEIKPAIEVVWRDEVNKNKFPDTLIKELSKSMPATVNRIKIDFEISAASSIIEYAETKKARIEMEQVVKEASDKAQKIEKQSENTQRESLARVLESEEKVIKSQEEADKKVNRDIVRTALTALGAIIATTFIEKILDACAIKCGNLLSIFDNINIIAITVIPMACLLYCILYPFYSFFWEPKIDDSD